MRTKHLSLFLLAFIISYTFFAQKTSISYESNGKNAQLKTENPFAKFYGEWTLKNDDWSQNWGYGDEQIKIPNHHTVSTGINTKNSLISIIDGPEPNGQIYWSYNPVTKEVNHLSSFGDIRAGRGKGTVDENGNLRLKLFFEGEAKNTYRIYTYTWVNDDEYVLKSVQYDQKDQPTGLFYSGTFVRVTKKDPLAEVQSILKVLDNNDIPIEEQLKVYSAQIVHMAPNNKAIDNKKDLKSYLQQQRTYGKSVMMHEVIDLEVVNDDFILMRGRVTGTFYPKNGGDTISFQTKNLFTFERFDGELKITKVIYNMSPVSKK